MSDSLDTLWKKMEQAALALDFEEAKRLRDMIGAMRGGATLDEAEQANFAGLERQQPGKMGLGTSQQRITPPAGWQPPSKPDPMTTDRPARYRRSKS